MLQRYAMLEYAAAEDAITHCFDTSVAAGDGNSDQALMGKGCVCGAMRLLIRPLVIGRIAVAACTEARNAFAVDARRLVVV